MRILHVIQEFAAGGGAEQVVAELVRGAQQAGHDVAVAAAPGSLSNLGGSCAYPMPVIGRRPGRVPQAVVALDRAIRSARPSLLHAHNPAMAAVAGAVGMRGRRVKGLVTVHGVPDEDYASTTRVLRLAGIPVVSCGPGVTAGLREQGCRVEATIVNGVSSPPPPATRRELADEWGAPEDQPLIVSVGRLVPLKNHALAIRTLASMPQGTLAIVGEGPLLADLRSQASAEGVAERVVFAGLRPDARAIMGAADVVVMPSRSEGLPLVVLEALAAGTPLVATAVRGIRELLTDGENALLVAADDPNALASAILRVLEDGPLCARLRAGGLRLTASHSVDAMISAYLRLYETLTSR